MKRCATRAWLAMAVVITACDQPPDYETEQGQIGLRSDGLDGDLHEHPAAMIDAAVGSRVCLRFDGWFSEDGGTYHIRSAEQDDGWLRECFTIDTTAGAHLDEDGCIVLDGVGKTGLELSPHACDLTEDGPTFVADRLPLEARATGELALSYDDVAARVIYDALDPGPAGDFGPRLDHVAGTPLRVIAGASFTAFLQPVMRDDPAHTVAFSGGTAKGVGDGAPVVNGTDGTAIFELEVDQRFALQLALPGGTLEGDEIIGVDPELATAMSIVVGYQPCETCADGYSTPSYAMALLQDDQGERLWGGDVSWSIEGGGAQLGEGVGLATVVELSAACAEGDAGQARTATLHASAGALSASAALAFTCPEPGLEDAWEVEIVDGDDAPEPSACTCDARGNAVPPSGLAMLALMVFARRRRPRHFGIGGPGLGSKPSISRS